MKTRINQPHIYGTPVVTDSRTFPPTQRELVIASLLARPDAHGSQGTGQQQLSGGREDSPGEELALTRRLVSSKHG